MGCGRKDLAFEEVFASGSSSKKPLNGKKYLHQKNLRKKEKSLDMGFLFRLIIVVKRKMSMLCYLTVSVVCQFCLQQTRGWLLEKVLWLQERFQSQFINVSCFTAFRLMLHHKQRE